MNTNSRSHSNVAKRLLAAVIALPALFVLMAAEAQTVVQLKIDGGIGAATAEYVIAGIEHAEEQNADLVLIQMDTPGGLMGAMRDIITKILNSSVPVATYVHPAGARADSAGTFILMASHIAAMSPTTHVGAATPVSITGDDIAPRKPADKPLEKSSEDSAAEDDATTDQDTVDGSSEEPATAMGRKVMNDSVAYIRNLADRHGRNADWAEKAVRDAETLSAEKALEMNVIDLIAADRDELLAAIDGREVNVNSDTVALQTAGAAIEKYDPSWRIKLLSVIQQPEVILLLGLIGIYGLLFEGYNPGAIVPGVVGAICLLLALYSVQVLPINYAGVALIVLGIALMVAEAFAPSFGALGLGGIAAFVFGAIMMFDSGIPGFGISIPFVLGIAVIAALFIVWMAGYLVKLRKRGPVYGEETMIGSVATAMQDFSGDGKVWLEGEAWAARSTLPISKDENVIVTAIDGLTLDVEPAPAGAANLHATT